MKYKGFNWKRADDLHWRPFDPLRDDPDSRHEGYGGNYCVVIKVQDCLDPDSGEWDAAREASAPAIPFEGWTSTNMLIGKMVRHYKRRIRIIIDGEVLPEYWTRSLFLIHDARVYRRTLYLRSKPD